MRVCNHIGALGIGTSARPFAGMIILSGCVSLGRAAAGAGHPILGIGAISLLLEAAYHELPHTFQLSS